MKIASMSNQLYYLKRSRTTTINITSNMANIMAQIINWRKNLLAQTRRYDLSSARRLHIYDAINKKK